MVTTNGKAYTVSPCQIPVLYIKKKKRKKIQGSIYLLTFFSLQTIDDNFDTIAAHLHN